MNLLKETLEVLEESGKTEKDVLYVLGINNGEMKIFYNTFEYFKKIADKNYDSGFGGDEVQLGLKIVGKDFWLERHEYDGSERWEYKKTPTKPSTKGDIEIFNK